MQDAGCFYVAWFTLTDYSRDAWQVFELTNFYKVHYPLNGLSLTYLPANDLYMTV